MDLPPDQIEKVKENITMVLIGAFYVGLLIRGFMTK